MLSREQILELILFACEKNGVPELAPQIKWRWSKKYTRKMGSAEYKKLLITLSRPLFLTRATEDDQKQTVVHEACHLIAFYKFYNNYQLPLRLKPHGRELQQAMLRCGKEPRRCHKVPLATVAHFECNCRKEIFVSRLQEKRIRRAIILGSYYTCRKCKGKLRLKEKVSA